MTMRSTLAVAAPGVTLAGGPALAKSHDTATDIAAAIIQHVNADDLSEGEAAYTDRLRAMVIGMAIGGFIAEFTVDPDAFCGSVDDFVSAEGDEALIAKR